MDMLAGMFSHWNGIIAVILVLGGLIFFHELGHFAAARRLGIGVRTFSIGFGPKIRSWHRGKTEYCLSLIPLGGYVSLAGEEDNDVQDDLFSEKDFFSNRPPLQRLAVILAGPFSNFLVALILYFGLALIQGEMYLTTEVGQVRDNQPAAEAGIQQGDIILSINNRPVIRWDEVGKLIHASHGEPLQLLISRNGECRKISITPREMLINTNSGDAVKRWAIGIHASGKLASRPLNLIESLSYAFTSTGKITASVWNGFLKIITGSVSRDNIGGPILIAQVVDQQASEGVLPVLYITALISINLGILNLLPVPVLDGGHAMFLILEMIFRRPVNERVRTNAAKVGMFLLLALMIFATWNDIRRLFS
ncbi:MAG: RIP metalloprotease RseP [Desulfovibrionaceae bacterium]|nr:RIP metalloprotease RseP [Desulfovibrionaceae bacterium]